MRQISIRVPNDIFDKLKMRYHHERISEGKNEMSYNSFLVKVLSMYINIIPSAKDEKEAVTVSLDDIL